MNIPENIKTLYTNLLLQSAGIREGLLQGENQTLFNLVSKKTGMSHSPATKSQIRHPASFFGTNPAHFVRTQDFSLEKSYLFPNQSKTSANTSSEVIRDQLLQAGADQILPLMEYYLATTPANPGGVSVYDYARLLTALTLCVKENPAYEKPYIFIIGDISGIQDFIFDIVSKRAAKSLKSRSFRVQALAHIAVDFLLDRLKLTPAHLVYSGGGNFFLLAPASAEDQIKALYATLQKQLINDKLDLYLGWSAGSLDEIQDFSAVWERANKSLQKNRLTPYQGASYEEIFTEMAVGNVADMRERQAQEYSKKTSLLTQSPAYIIKAAPGNAEADAFTLAGRRLKLFSSPPPKSVKAVYLDSPPDPGMPRRLTVRKLPVWTDFLMKKYEEEILNRQEKARQNGEEEELVFKHSVIEFGYLAGFAGRRTGTEKLAVLRMDVDRLGSQLKDGLNPGCRSLMHRAAISRSLKWFFEGYINTLLDQPLHHRVRLRNSRYLSLIGDTNETFRDNIYPMYSGGDDLFFVGAWDAIFEFAEIVHKEFKEFTQSSLSISAGIVLVGSKYPVSRFAQLAGEAEDQAKNAGRNRISIFGISLKWKDYLKALELRDYLYELVSNAPVVESRAVLMKIMKGRQEFLDIREQSRTGKRLRLPRVWRLKHHLRDTRKENRQALLTQVIDPYEKALYDSLRSSSAEEPGYIFVATRWTEFLTRNLK